MQRTSTKQRLGCSLNKNKKDVDSTVWDWKARDIKHEAASACTADVSISSVVVEASNQLSKRLLCSKRVHFVYFLMSKNICSIMYSKDIHAKGSLHKKYVVSFSKTVTTIRTVRAVAGNRCFTTKFEKTKILANFLKKIL